MCVCVCVCVCVCLCCWDTQVLDVLHSVLVALGASHPELTKSVLSFLVSLIVSGAAAPTLHLAQEWSKQADPSLLRHFIELVGVVRAGWFETFSDLATCIKQSCFTDVV